MTNKIEEKIDLLLKDKNRRDTVEVTTNLLRKVKNKFHNDNHEKYYNFAHLVVKQERIDEFKLLVYLIFDFMKNNKDKKLAKRFFNMFGTMKKNIKHFKLLESHHVKDFIKYKNFEDSLFFLNLLFKTNKTTEKGKNLKLVLTYHWFDEIEAGRKTVEYREVKDTWKRLETEKYTTVTFYRGYAKNRKEMTFEIKSIEKMNGKNSDLHIDKDVYAINLGKRK